MEERWSVPIDDWEKADKESLMFIFQQSQKYYDSVFKVGGNITTRSYTFLAILISFISFFASLAFSGDFPIKDLPFCYYYWLFPVLIAFIILTYNILPHKMMHNGYIPKSVNYKDFFSLSSFKKTYNALLLDQIEDNQQKIEFTTKSNRRRLFLLNIAIILTTLAIFYLVSILII